MRTRKKVTRILFVPDAHRPFHDVKAWRLMLKAARAFRPDIIVVLGDFLDCCSISAHSRNPLRKIQLEAEALSGREGLDQLQRIPGVKRRIFVEGNHEDRLRRFLWDKAPELFGLIDTQGLLQLKERGWEFVPYGEGIQLGKVYVTHDLRGSGQYAVARALSQAGKSVVLGHLHRLQVIYGGTSFGRPHVAACFGWLARSDVAHSYKHKLTAQREYQHGFGIGYMEKNGTVHLQAIPIIDYRCCIEGQIVAL